MRYLSSVLIQIFRLAHASYFSAVEDPVALEQQSRLIAEAGGVGHTSRLSSLPGIVDPTDVFSNDAVYNFDFTSRNRANNEFTIGRNSNHLLDSFETCDPLPGYASVPVVNVDTSALYQQPFANGEYPCFNEGILMAQEESNTTKLNNAVNEALMDSDPDALGEVLSEAVRVRETVEKSRLVSKGVRKPGMFCLTFDEGPAANTPRLLRILKKYNRKCGFYLDPFKITREAVPTLTQILKDGHLIGLSIRSDSTLTEMTAEMSHSIIDKYVDRYESLIGWMPHTARLPREGYYSDDIRHCMSRGVVVCEPTYDTMDYASPNILEPLEEALKTQYDASTDSVVIVLRDKYGHSVDNVKSIISLMELYGYRYSDYDAATGFRSINKEGSRRSKRRWSGRNRTPGNNELLCMLESEHEFSKEASEDSSASAETLAASIAANVSDALEKKEKESKSVQVNVKQAADVKEKRITDVKKGTEKVEGDVLQIPIASISKAAEPNEAVTKTSAGSLMVRVMGVGGVLLIVAFFI
ncbi:hypothetical protein NEMIN01_1869 [Nematocida minor]|uniref:uncharacterized protein n=1 Tax=Nematocida minor TaxID=1912983 RepID=UPI00221FD578|nr:uncharacterized protein NEMIN01_1869 [Nematocida minor]KAI5192200.1 hypothetical protein NEMIN01_1869 [Nematocida minor]